MLERQILKECLKVEETSNWDSFFIKSDLFDFFPRCSEMIQKKMYQLKIVHRVDKAIPFNLQEGFKKLAVNSSVFCCVAW